MLLDHIDAVIYTLLTAQATWSLYRDPPWTAQFTKRIVAPEAWTRPEFRSMNRFATALWAACFAVCDLVALTVGHPVRLYLPIALMLATAVLSRRLSRVYLARLLGVPVTGLTSPWV